MREGDNEWKRRGGRAGSTDDNILSIFPLIHFSVQNRVVVGEGKGGQAPCKNEKLRWSKC